MKEESRDLRGHPPDDHHVAAVMVLVWLTGLGGGGFVGPEAAVCGPEPALRALWRALPQVLSAGAGPHPQQEAR